MPDAVFEHPRLVGIYDALEPDREDLRAYLAMASEFRARRVLDIGCGTGVFALLLADLGVAVTGVDPAAGSLDVARARPGAERVTWIHGDATRLPPLQVELATMTGNVARAITSRTAWLGRSDRNSQPTQSLPISVAMRHFGTSPRQARLNLHRRKSS